MSASFEYITTPEYRLKAANTQIHAFKSGEIYVHIQEGIPERTAFSGMGNPEIEGQAFTSDF